jgi:hypothetical protein
VKVYFTAQGGDYDKANTLYFWPSLSLSNEEKEGFDFGDGKKYHWVLCCAWLVWAVGVMW